MRKYIKPEIEIQRFAPNEFCSACDSIYNFQCNAGRPHYFYEIWEDSNHNGELDVNYNP